MDETSFSQGKGYGKNSGGRKGWLWVMVTPLVSYCAYFVEACRAARQGHPAPSLLPAEITTP